MDQQTAADRQELEVIREDLKQMIIIDNDENTQLNFGNPSPAAINSYDKTIEKTGDILDISY